MQSRQSWQPRLHRRRGSLSLSRGHTFRVLLHAPVSAIHGNQERGQEHGLLPETHWQRPRHSPLLSPQRSRVPPILPHRVPGDRPGKPSQPPCPFPRTHSHAARCPGLCSGAFAVRIPRNRGRQTELLLPTTGHPERTLAQEALLRTRSQHNDRALIRGQVPHVPLFRLLLFPLWLPSPSSIPDLAFWTVSRPICWLMEVCSKRFPRCGSSIFRLAQHSSIWLGKPFWPPPDALRRKTRATKSSAISGSRSCGTSGNTGSSQLTTGSFSIYRTSATPVIGARDYIQVGETASYRTTTSARKFKIWHHNAKRSSKASWWTDRLAYLKRPRSGNQRQAQQAK